MQFIDLLNVPNQTFSITLEEVTWDISLKIAGSSLISSIKKNNVLIMDSLVVSPALFLIPYFYQNYNTGNFVFYTPDDEYPDYTKFGITHFLIYFTKDEIASLYPVNNIYSVDSIVPFTQTVYFLLQNGDKFELQDGGSFLLQDSKDI